MKAFGIPRNLTIPIELQNCEIKKPRYGNVYNLMLRSRSVIKESKRAIDAESLIQDHDYAMVDEVQLDRLQEIEVFVKISISAQAVEVKDVEAIGDKLYVVLLYCILVFIGVSVSFVSLIGQFVGYCILICLSY